MPRRPPPQLSAPILPVGRLRVYIPLVVGAYMLDSHIDLLFHEQVLKVRYEEMMIAIQKKEGG